MAVIAFKMSFLFNNLLSLTLGFAGAATAMMYTLPAAADPQIAVSQDELRCILRQARAYRSQGEVIVLNFRTCPEPPNFRETLRAHDAKNFFPPVAQSESDAERPTVSAQTPPVLLVTREEFDCLLAELGLPEIGAATDPVLVLPNDCQANRN